LTRAYRVWAIAHAADAIRVTIEALPLTLRPEACQGFETPSCVSSTPHPPRSFRWWGEQEGLLFAPK
jgi:hypothetical protein